MDRNAKIGIAAIVGIILLGICACLGVFWYLGSRVMQAVVTDPDEIAKIRQQIAEYAVPQGYEENGMRLFGFQAIMLSNYDLSPENFTLLSFPSNMEIGQEEIDQAMQQVSQQDQDTTWEQMETLPVTIMGQSIEMLVSEGGEEGSRVRRMQCGWSGRSGMVVLQISGSVEGWDQAVVDAFLASIR